MEYLIRVTLSTAGRPTLYENEVELRITSPIQLLVPKDSKTKDSSDYDTLIPSGLSIITNCRLIFITQSKSLPNGSDGAMSIGWALMLKDILTVRDSHHNIISIFREPAIISIRVRNECEFRVRFLEDGKVEFLKCVSEALNKKSWEKFMVNSSTNNVDSDKIDRPIFSSSNAGISGILKKQEKDIETVDSLRKSALSDLDSLMKSASEVVKVVKKYSSYLDDRKSSLQGSETESIIGDTNEIEELLQNIGLISPVTRLTAGRVYYQQLARQLVDILFTNDRLKKLGGMITLPDLYCVVNRARGTELLSPEDLFQACKTINSLSLGIVFKCFPSGVMVLQLDAFSDTKLYGHIHAMFESYSTSKHVSGNPDSISKFSGINITTAAMLLHLSVVVTKEILLEAERRCIICRDESSDGLYFFLNLFPSW